MNTDSSPWDRLVAKARQAPLDARPVHPPLGFATRIVARAQQAAAEPVFEQLLHALCWRGLAVAAVLMLGSVFLHYAEIEQTFSTAHAYAWSVDPVSDLLDLS